MASNQIINLPAGTATDSIRLLPRDQPLPGWARYPQKYGSVQYLGYDEHGYTFHEVPINAYAHTITIRVPLDPSD